MQLDFEIVLVDDASPDDSWSVIQGLAATTPNLHAIRLMRNSGQVKATLCGLSHARGEIVITMDDDLQHRPDQLPLMLAELESRPEIDCVFGVFPQKRHAKYRNVGSRVIQWVNKKAFGLSGKLRTSSFRCMRRPLVDVLLTHRTRTPSLLHMIMTSTSRIDWIEVEHADRYAGESNYTIERQLLLAFDNICSVSMLPLRFVSMLGGVSFCLGLAVAAHALIDKLTGSTTVSGWTTVVILVALFSGMILLSLGIIGEYLVRILREVKSGPLYQVREIEIAENHAANTSVEIDHHQPETLSVRD